MSMGKKDQNQKDKERVQTVLQLLKKQAPLNVKEEKFSKSACVERFLKAKGDNVKKATRQLRSCLAWRESLGTAKLAEGIAYVAGQDDASRPVMVHSLDSVHIGGLSFPICSSGRGMCGLSCRLKAVNGDKIYGFST